LDELLKKLVSLYKALRSDVRENWNRDLPSYELAFDRWERAKYLGFGEGSSIYQSSYVYGQVTVGKNTWIGPYTLLDGSGELTIGDYCSISAGVHIYTHDTVKWALSGGRAEYERAAVTVGDCCYIGSQTVINKGVAIGDHSVIGAGSFVNRDIAPYTVAYGSPCRPMGRVRVGESGDVTIVLDPDRSAGLGECEGMIRPNVDSTET
jgi:acetyltransferase-like isoleucine patch superfamily enzyme